MNDFWLCFVPLFIAVDAFGVLPIFMGLTQGVEKPSLRLLIVRSAMAALIVAFIFLMLGHAVLKLLGITVADFMVAGGIVLFALALADLLATDKLQSKISGSSAGVVPLGVPLITGPAVLATSMLLVEQYGPVPVAVAITANVLIAASVFSFASHINRLLGEDGARIVSKIAMLLLAAIAVMMVRRGIESFVATAG